MENIKKKEINIIIIINIMNNIDIKINGKIPNAEKKDNNGYKNLNNLWIILID